MTTTNPDATKCICPTFDGEQAISVACPVHGTPTDKPDEANAVDPGAIDLEAIQARRKPTAEYHGELTYADVTNLIAAVEALREKAFNAYCEGWDVAHEPARCGHARANYKDPKFGTPEYKGNEKCEACAEVEALRERVALLQNDQVLGERIIIRLEGILKETKARGVELAEAINAWMEHRHDVFCAQVQGTFDEMPTNRIDEIVQQCEDALVATPAEALERARAVEANHRGEKP